MNRAAALVRIAVFALSLAACGDTIRVGPDRDPPGVSGVSGFGDVRSFDAAGSDVADVPRPDVAVDVAAHGDHDIASVDLPYDDERDADGAPLGETERARCDDGQVYPEESWAVARPSEHGMDSRDLELAARYAEENDSYCLVVARHGRIVGEWYFGDTTVETPVRSWSVGKSYAATVAGLALQAGMLGDVRDPVVDYVPAWEGRGRDDITIHHLLSMTSGLHFDLVGDNVGITMARDMTQRAVENASPRRPGYAWEYNNHTVQMIEPVLRGATGLPPDEFAQRALFEPLGMDAEWEEDAAGNPAMYMNVVASCRDHARFGQLYLRDGGWEGEELLSDEFVSAAVSPSSGFNQGYGYWWWLNGHEPLLDSVTFEDMGRMMHPFAPHDAFCAVGLGNQMVEVIPSLDMVVVRMGPAPQENLRLWLTDRGRIMEDLQSDGEQRVHNGVLERVLAAVRH